MSCITAKFDSPSGISDEGPELASGFCDKLGFDTVNMGPLSESWRTERDRPAYVIGQNAAELAENLAKAPRTI